ncbi:hypothetical protein MML48_5g00016384 [Holotrichia oblita]|uniref:Uncharacterized protein n=1 Tax=Holotrichia oblita TaxID=644536 RepID=A0ACB9T432_HOLOL|nr:hypothetical protein MML48_5g00016384 [Holotrichia oblita]
MNAMLSEAISNKLDHIEIFLETHDHPVHALAITEHWLDSNKLPFIRIDGYVMASCYVRTNKIHGGPCLFVQNDILFIERIDLKERSAETMIECSAVEIPNENLIFTNLYRPPSGNVATFFDVFVDIMTSATEKKHKYSIVVTGDFNNDFQNKELATTKEFHDIVMSQRHA